jgi:hypothetical protein
MRDFRLAAQRSGFTFSGDDPVMVTAVDCPELPGQLAAFCRACASVKDFGFYLFRRCDLGVFQGKQAPDFADALAMTPTDFQTGMAETDTLLKQMRFKREIFVDEGDAGYRIRYAKKGELVVYWSRVQETFHTDYRHYLRWKIDSDLSPRLFAALDQSHPGLAERVFAGMKTCAGCYGDHCLARATLERDGVVKNVCKEMGWSQIGYERGDYEALWAVLRTLNGLVN